MSLEAIDLLTRIADRLESIDRNIATLVAQRRAAAPKPVASDRELDGKYGNPVVKFNPRDWMGGSFKGRRMSECPAPFLELLALTFDYFGDQAEQKNERTDNGKPIATYKRTDAARARGWAKRVREGKVQPSTLESSSWAGTPEQSAPDGEWAETAAEGF